MVSRTRLLGAVGLCLLIALAGCSFFPTSDTSSTHTDASAPATDIPDNSYPPSTGPDGISSVLSVVNAHNDATANRSYTTNVTIIREFPDETRSVTLTANHAYNATPGQSQYLLHVRKYLGSPADGSLTGYRDHYRGPIDGVPLVFGRGTGSYGNNSIVAAGYDPSTFETRFMVSALGDDSVQYTPVNTTTRNGQTGVVFKPTNTTRPGITVDGQVVIAPDGTILSANLTYAKEGADRRTQFKWSTTITEPQVTQPNWTMAIANPTDRWNVSVTAVNGSYIEVTNHDERPIAGPVGIAYVQTYDRRASDDTGVATLTGATNWTIAPGESVYVVPNETIVTTHSDPPTNTTLDGQIRTKNVPVNIDRGSVVVYGPAPRTQSDGDEKLSDDTVYAIVPVTTERSHTDSTDNETG